jgi:hypothetical protein
MACIILEELHFMRVGVLLYITLVSVKGSNFEILVKVQKNLWEEGVKLVFL